MDDPTHLCQASSIMEIFCRLGWRFLTESIKRLIEKDSSGDSQYLAYAALHCSSRLALAVSMSAEETKREPTAPVEMDGTASSIVDCCGQVKGIVSLRDSELEDPAHPIWLRQPLQILYYLATTRMKLSVKNIASHCCPNLLANMVHEQGDGAGFMLRAKGNCAYGGSAANTAYSQNRPAL
jgi:hypothetical protein